MACCIMRRVTYWRYVCKMIELVLGGARSGKSRYAEQQALSSARQVVYIATGQAGDEEMEQRIAHHRQRRPADWQTVEEPYLLADCIRQFASPEHCLLIDCLTLWLTNVLFDRQGHVQQAFFQQQRQALLETLTDCRQTILLVSNEVGLGIVAADAMTRRFVDEAGFLHQDLAKVCDHVTFVTAGLPQRLK